MRASFNFSKDTTKRLENDFQQIAVEQCGKISFISALPNLFLLLCIFKGWTWFVLRVASRTTSANSLSKNEALTWTRMWLFLMLMI